MSKIIEQQLRRIEIVGMVSLSPNSFNIGDLANAFGRDEEMIKKDLQALREAGIDIHQTKKRGIAITYDVQSEILDFYLQQYMQLNRSDTRKDKVLTQIVKKKGKFAVGLIVTLQRAIREKVTVEFEYIQNEGDQAYPYTVDPLMLFQREGLWRLLALYNKTISQFHITKITSIHMTTRKFIRPDQHLIDDQFRYSWGTWISGDQIPIQLQLTSFWAERLSALPAVEDQIIKPNGSNNYIFQGTVNSIEEVARWVAGRNGEVVVLSPLKLRNKVRSFAQECLNKHLD